MEWMKEAAQRAARDARYVECMNRLCTLEAEFLAFRDTLSEEKQNLLDDYLTACEDLDTVLTRYAFKIGQEKALFEEET